LIGDAVAFLGILIGTATARTAVRTTRKLLVTDRVSLPCEQTQPVVWVFGHLVGFPGADKRLMPQSGSMGGQVRVPPTSGAWP
jgi:xanthosine utilization system XapX-like protein